MSGASEVKDDRRYSKDHEWALAKDGEILVGITSFAVEQLGDITLVNIDVKVGAAIEAGKVFGTIESVKTLSDLFAPLSGTITRINDALETAPELVNEDPWTKAWMIAIKPTNASGIDSLLDAASYRKHLSESDH